MMGSLNQTFTCDGNDHVPTSKDVIKACVIVCVSIGIVVGNLFSVIVFNSKTSRKVFLKKIRLTMNSLICTDLSMGLLMCPFCIYSALYKCWPFTETFCRIEALMLSALFHESTLSLVLIALDRYFSVHHYLRYNSFMTSRKYVIIILLTWISTFGVYAVVIFEGNQFYFDSIGVNCEPFYENRNVTIAVIVLFYFIPTILFVYSYGSIFVAANRKRNTWLSTSNARIMDHKNNVVTQILKTSKYLAAITIGYFVAVTPWTVCTLTISVTNIKLNEDVDFAVTWLAISNSFWNVIIYSVMNRKFRFAVTSIGRRHKIRKCNGQMFGFQTADTDTCMASPFSLRHHKNASDWRLSRSTINIACSGIETDHITQPEVVTEATSKSKDSATVTIATITTSTTTTSSSDSLSSDFSVNLNRDNIEKQHAYML